MPRFQARAIGKHSTNSSQSCYYIWNEGKKNTSAPGSTGRGESAGTANSSAIRGTWLLSTEVRKCRSLKHKQQPCSRATVKQRRAVLLRANSELHFIAEEMLSYWLGTAATQRLCSKISHQGSPHGSNLLLAPWHLNLQMTTIWYCLTSTNMAIQRLLAPVLNPPLDWCSNYSKPSSYFRFLREHRENSIII